MKNFIKKNIRFVCDIEMESLKPGNVHKYSKSHDMTTKDFFRSSLIVSKYLSQNNLSLGKKIINTVMQIQKKIKKNTNLGIILMLAPIVVVFSLSAWLWIAPRLRAFTGAVDSVPLADYVGFRVESNIARSLAALIVISASFLYMIAVFKGVGSLLEIFLDILLLVIY